MEYFKLLHLAKEPFSNSPDPAFFYASEQHKDCIQKLEIALRLRRGLNVVTGEVGTGKTTLCRQLIQAFSGDPRISAGLVLDPDFSDPRSFLSAVVHMMTSRKPALVDTIPDMKEHLKNYLFQKGVEEDRTVVLIVDEGQKMSPACLETLRELLNFETNEYKLLQIIIFAQNEFSDTLDQLPNLADRINLYYRLGPLNFKDSRELIHHRLQLAVGPEGSGRRLFSLPAQWRIFRLSGGYPRKIIHLCHQSLLAMIIQNKAVVGWRIVGACARRTLAGKPVHHKLAWLAAAVLLLGICLGVWVYPNSPRKIITFLRDHRGNAAPDGRIPSTVQVETAARQPESAPIPAPLEAVVEDTPNTAPLLSSAPESTSLGGSFDVGRSTLDIRRSSFDKSNLQNPPSSESPPLLGEVPVAVGDTLDGLIHKIYGAHVYRYRKAVLTANPQLTDPDLLRVGDVLVFPAQLTDTIDAPDPSWYVSIWRGDNLGAAVSKLREEAENQLPLRLLTLWNGREGLSFQVVLKKSFNNQAAAELERSRTAPMVSAHPDIICLKKATPAIMEAGMN